MKQLNIFGETLISCSETPLTGFFRDGCCHTSDEDAGSHTVCAIMTDEFLDFSKSRGNDLSTPVPQFQFEGLKAGDKWCLCAARFKEAVMHGCAPKVLLEATHERCLEVVSMDDLLANAHYQNT